ncbi:MAG: 4-alpha-glucanotransferase [Bacillota bacterium]
MYEKQVKQLHQLARLNGIETAYYDVTGIQRQATPESLLAALRSLGAPVETMADVCDAVRETRLKKLRRRCEPVWVTWDGRPVRLELSLPVFTEGLADCVLNVENGEVRRWTCNLNDLPVLRTAEAEGEQYIVRELVLPSGLPWGYHRFTIVLQDGAYESMVISAPLKAYNLPGEPPMKTWGVFIPLYALHSERSLGAGDLTDLKMLLGWIRGLGGSLVGTLPLLAAYLDEPFDPSPYAPVSRLFWNEFYIDVAAVPELGSCPEAREILDSGRFQRETAELRKSSLVDYRRGMSAKRKLLEKLAACCYSRESDRLAALLRWVVEHPEVQDYARFRATAERQRAGWPVWPVRMREGELREEDYDTEAERYHLYVQWVIDQQLRSLANGDKTGLYLDLPLGVNGGGYDVWRERSAFALDASTGAPPDPFFSQGQDWGFPPLHPERIREQGYRYYIACLRNHLQHASALRLDHVMALHRLFWVPKGVTAREGVYVRYRPEEFYAILTIESQKHKAVIVGEDLGTVPPDVRTAMSRHGINRMYILPFELTGNPQRPLNQVSANTLTSLNTHDMPPFAAFWSTTDKHERSKLAAFLQAESRLERPADDTNAVMDACLRYLAASPAQFLIINLEDLWLETAPQNVPGANDYPNWRRKARHSFEEFSRMPEVLNMLAKINGLRRGQHRGQRQAT